MHVFRRIRPSSAVAQPRLRLAAFALLVGSALAFDAQAATFEVTNTADSGTGSLRDAIAQANLAPGADEITFDAAVTGTIVLDGSIVIIDDLAIVGPGREVLDIDGDAIDRIFDIGPFGQPARRTGDGKLEILQLRVSIAGLTLSNGYGSGKGSEDSDGGCVRAMSTALEIVATRVADCRAEGTGGGIAMIYREFGALPAQGPTSLVLRDVEVAGNTAGASGGGISAAIESTAPGAENGFLLVDSRVESNGTGGGESGMFAPGGGVEVFGYAPFDIEVRDSSFSTNAATGFAGGGLIVYQDHEASTTTITRSVFVRNAASVELDSGFYAGGGGAAWIGSGRLHVEDSRFEGNAVAGEMLPPERGFPDNNIGGGLLVQPVAGFPSVTVQGSVFLDNEALFGGGLGVIARAAPMPVRAGKSHWRSPSAPRASRGGPVVTPGVTVSGSLFEANIAPFAPGLMLSAYPLGQPPETELPDVVPFLLEGITVTQNEGETSFLELPSVLAISNAPTRLVNSTLSDNRAGGIAGGGPFGGELLLVDNSTIVDNVGSGVLLPENTALPALVPALKGKAYGPQSRAVAVRNSVVHGNTDPKSDEATDFVGDASLLMLLHTATAMSADALEGVEDAGGNQFDVDDPMLGGLGDNGGGTPTRAPLDGSPLIDAGDPDFAVPPDTDQRGNARVQGDAVDIGAVEITSLPPPAPGVLQFDPASASVDEDAGTVTLRVSRTGGSDGEVGVAWSTADGTAQAGSDYTAASGTLSWAAGDTAAKTLTVAILDDALVEADETFTVALEAPTGDATLGAADTATVTIASDDAPPLPEPGVLQFDPVSASVAENAGTVTLRVSRTGGSDGTVGVAWSTADATADAGSDYTAASGTLSWADGDATAKTFTVAILDDALVEADETFTVALAAPTGDATLGAADTATVTIVSDDLPPEPGVLQFVGADEDGVLRLRVNEDGSVDGPMAKGVLMIAVQRSGGSDGPASVDYATADGTATAPSDYAATSGTLSWADGDTGARMIALTLVDDDTPPEPDEIFRILLTGAQGAGLESLQAEILIVANGTLEPAPSAPAVIPANDWRGRLALFGAMLLAGFVVLRRRLG